MLDVHDVLVYCSQLFGEADADEEVSPDTEDPEAVGGAGEKAVQNQEKENVAGGIERASTRTWAEEIGYDPVKLFNKVSYVLLLLSSQSQCTFTYMCICVNKITRIKLKKIKFHTDKKKIYYMTQTAKRVNSYK